MHRLPSECPGSPVSGGRPLVNTDDHRFSDFYYPWEPESPAGVYEIGIAAEVLSKIEEIAAEWGRRSPKNEPRRFRAAMCDCQVANDWAAALVSAGVHCRTEGQLVDRLGPRATASRSESFRPGSRVNTNKP